jgi:hypothetical protein
MHMAVNIIITTSLFVTFFVCCTENVEIHTTSKGEISYIETEGRISMNEEA